jgi:hypothetical protein
MSVEFTDNKVKVLAAMNKAIEQFLEEAGGEVRSEVARQSPVDTGQLKSSWDYVVDKGNQEVTIGSPIENAIWNEYGTGEYAYLGGGRKGGWRYQDAKGKWHFTRGKQAQRTFWNAYTGKKNQIKDRAEKIIGGAMK